MKVDGTSYRTIWLAEDNWGVEIIDQTRLPHEFVIVRLESMEEASIAIKNMLVRGAPLIGATAAYGIALAMRSNPSDNNLTQSYQHLLATRPTAVNLRWALEDMKQILCKISPASREEAAYLRAGQICDEDVVTCSQIGNHGLGLIEEVWDKKGRTEAVNILTHCNAGWLATVDWGTALAPIYKAYNAGIPVHVWVDETRPRNQGASLTAWELRQHGVEHTVIVDNAGGHLMQHGMVDLCITGTDRTTSTGDVCNKIGTYLKALAAHDNKLPFFVGLPSTTIDWKATSGIRDIPIEERDDDEVSFMSGRLENGNLSRLKLTPQGSRVSNYAFDVTPRRLVTGLITERGVCEASEKGLRELFPEIQSHS